MKYFTRLISNIFSKKEVGIWYHPLYLPELYSHSEIRNVSIKYKTIMAFLYKNKLINPKEVKGPRRVTFTKLGFFHEDKYLESTTQSDFDFKSLGLNLSLGEGESLREAQRRVVNGTVEGMYSLTQGAIKVAINIGGGLHHAESDKASGFCLYNDVGVAIQYLRKKNYQGKILIIDLDFHQGNGNMEGLKGDKRVFQFGMSGVVWRDSSLYPNTYEIILPPKIDNHSYIKMLRDNIYKYVTSVKPDLICYICGNDVLKNDPYGTFNLDISGLFERDKIIYDISKKQNLPIQIVLGGGYSKSAWIGNARFIHYILKGSSGDHLDFTMNDTDQMYTLYLEKINPRQESKKDIILDQNDLFPEMTDKKNIQRLFNYYTRGHIEYQMNRLGIYHKLKRKGHHDLWIEIVERPGNQNMIRLKSKVGQTTHLLIESVVEIINYVINDFDHPLKLLNVEWLLAQNPLEPFTEERPQLPGQDHPGLGIAEEILSMFVEACHRFNLDGVIHCPSHYHVALKALKHFHYPAPQDEALFKVIKKTLASYSLLEASTIMANKKLYDSNDNIISIDNKKLIYPVSIPLQDYFNSDRYQSIVDEFYENIRPTLQIK